MQIIFANTELFWMFKLSAYFFKKSLFQKTLFRNVIRLPNSLDLDQVPYFVGPDLGQKGCQQKISWTELNVTISINAINFYLLRGSEPDCLIL